MSMAKSQKGEGQNDNLKASKQQWINYVFDVTMKMSTSYIKSMMDTQKVEHVWQLAYLFNISFFAFEAKQTFLF